MYSGGESSHTEAEGNTFHSTGTAAWAALAAECISSLPEPKAAQSPWGLPGHNPAFSHHGNAVLLKSGLCFSFAFLSHWGTFWLSCSLFFSPCQDCTFSKIVSFLSDCHRPRLHTIEGELQQERKNLVCR